MTDTSNSSALVALETLKPEVFLDKGIDPHLQMVKAEVDAFIPDISTKKGRDEIKSLAHKIARSKTALDKLGFNLVSEWKIKSKQVDAERSRAWDFLESLQKQVRRPLDEFEAKEEERIKRLEDLIGQLETYKTVSSESSVEYLNGAIKALEAIQIGESWEEFEARAFRIKNEGLEHLRKCLATRVKHDSDQAELAKLRADQLAREQKERDDKIAQEAAQKAKEEAEKKAQEDIRLEKERTDRIEQKMKEALEQQQKAELDAKAAKEKAIKEKAESEERAKQATIKAEADKKAAEEKAREDERKRLADEQSKKDQEAKAREADIAHRKKINNEALTALVASSGLNEDQAKSVVESIAKGLIPNVKISY